MFKINNKGYVFQLGQNAFAKLMKPIRLTPHSRKHFKFVKKKGSDTSQGIRKGSESKAFIFPQLLQNSNEEVKEPNKSNKEGLVKEDREIVKKAGVVNSSSVDTKNPDLVNTDEANLSSTQKFDLPVFNRTLKSKVLVSLNSRNKNFISETYDTPSEPKVLSNPKNKSRNTKISINMPKTFDKNMKHIHKVYLKKETAKVSQSMRKKDLRIEIPELHKEEINHAELLSKLKNYLDKKSGASTVKKKTTDVDIEFF